VSIDKNTDEFREIDKESIHIWSTWNEDLFIININMYGENFNMTLLKNEIPISKKKYCIYF
jgi:hypothetical protein